MEKNKKSKLRNLEKIAFPVLDLTKCPKKQCKNFGDYIECYSDVLYVNCKNYDTK